MSQENHIFSLGAIANYKMLTNVKIYQCLDDEYRWKSAGKSIMDASQQGRTHMRSFSNYVRTYLSKYILQFGQIHFTIWTNTFHDLDKYI